MGWEEHLEKERGGIGRMEKEKKGNRKGGKRTETAIRTENKWRGNRRKDNAWVAEVDNQSPILYDRDESRVSRPRLLSCAFPRKKTKYPLRPRTHEYVLPYKDNFIPRVLYGDLDSRKD